MEKLKGSSDEKTLGCLAGPLADYKAEFTSAIEEPGYGGSYPNKEEKPKIKSKTKKTK